MRILSWLMSRFSKKAKEEYCLFKEATRSFTKEEKASSLSPMMRQKAVDRLVAFLESEDFKMIRVSGYNYISKCGTVTVCRDIYGPEVHVLGGGEMIDCRPAYYNLTREQATAIYDAICVKVYSDRIDS